MAHDEMVPSGVVGQGAPREAAAPGGAMGPKGSSPFIGEGGRTRGKPEAH